MSQLADKKDMVVESLSTIWGELASAIPNILGAIVILIFGWLITKLIVFIIKKALKLAKADKIDDKLNDIGLFGEGGVQFDIIKMVSSFVKWFLLLVFMVVAAEVGGLDMISQLIGDLMAYIPKLFAAIVIFLVGVFIASFIKNSLTSLFKSLEISGGNAIGQIVFALITVFVSITALNQAGIDTTIITSNITLILGALLLAFAIALGLGAKDAITRLIQAFYTRKTYELGQKIKFKDISGEIIAVNEISMNLKTKTGTLIVPIKDIVDNLVEIQE